MDALVTQLGVGGIFAILLIREVLGFLKQKNGGGSEVKAADIAKAEDWRNLVKQVQELHDWHDKEDSDGVKIWYFRRSLEKALVELSRAVHNLNHAIDKLIEDEDK